MEPSRPKLSWCRDANVARKLAKLFHDNLTSSYISHSELQGPRALAPGVWVPNIAEILETDILGRLKNPDDAPPGGATMLAASVVADEIIVGVVLVTFSRAGVVPFGVLEDVVISANIRGRGYGQACLDWVTQESRSRGISRVFLESGINNHRAHELFKRDGFEPVSVVMMKEVK